jgi:hypothetical protein
MRRSVLCLLLAAAALLGAGCATQEPADETANWSVERLYGEARDAMAERDWAKAIQYLEKLEARFPYGRLRAAGAARRRLGALEVRRARRGARRRRALHQAPPEPRGA